jgi:hypothetical protein
VTGTALVLVLGWGNPSRGDDALGPLFVERLSRELGDGAAAWLTDYQLQVEHALDLAGRRRVLFVDASTRCTAPFEVFQQIGAGEPPPCTLLAIRGEHFELGQPPGDAALAHLEQALQWGRGWLGRPDAT